MKSWRFLSWGTLLLLSHPIGAAQVDRAAVQSYQETLGKFLSKKSVAEGWE